MSQRKPGKLKANFFINVNAMKPGAVNPVIARKRRARSASATLLKHSSNADYKDEYKRHPDDKNATPISAKLNQVTITSKRRKKKRKTKKILLSNTTIPNQEQNTNNVFGINYNQNNNGLIMLHPPPTHNSQSHQKTPPPPLPPNTSHLQRTPPPPLPPSNPSKKSSISLIPPNPNQQFTPFGEASNDMDTTTPIPPDPQMPTPPPPPPPILNQSANRRATTFIDVKKAPPVPLPADLTNINKVPRDTSASTTLTVSGQKITIIGHARTGKTSLKNALFGRRFKEMTFPTVKAPPIPSVMVRPLRIMDDDEDDINVAYEIWDTPGQKVLDYIPPLYITGSFCVFIVYDITDTFSYDRAKYWVNYLEENAKGYDNVVLIGNKYDLHVTQRCIKSQEVQLYAQEHDIFFIEISVKTKHNFEVLLSWLNHKTQEKFKREIEMEQENDGDYKMEGIAEKNANGGNVGGKEKKQKQLLKQHRRNNKTIELHKIDVHSRNKKNRSCCLW